MAYTYFGVPIRPEVSAALAASLETTPVQKMNREDRALVTASGFFDARWYREKYPDIREMDPLEHFLHHGGYEGRAAGPEFDGGWYLAKYPDIAAANMHPLVHYLRHGKKEGRQRGIPERILMKARTLIDELEAVEPDIATDRAFMHVDRLNIIQSIARTELLDVWERILTSLNRNYDYLVFVPWLVRGGADLVAANAARAFVQKHGAHSVLVVLTDHDRKEAFDWLPTEADTLTISDFAPNLTHEDRIRLVEILISAFLPRTVLNVNSRACWDAIARRGAALSQMTRLFGTLFCRDYSVDGRAGGYADTHFRACLPHLTKVYVDNEHFIGDLSAMMASQALSLKRCSFCHSQFLLKFQPRNSCLAAFKVGCQ